MKKADILIVDDEATSLELLSRMLQSKGFRVRTLPNGELAIKSIESHPPDILLLDIGLPGMDGFEVCKQIKRLKNGDKLPVIFVSAYDDHDNIEMGYKVGAVDFIRKPYNKLEIYQKINLHLNILHYERELEILLSETVLGSIRALLDILGFINPEIYARSSRMARLMRKLVNKLKLDNCWMYETAALLNHLDEIIYASEGREVDSGIASVMDGNVINSRPKISEIVDSVPRMLSVAAMLDGKLSHNLLDERFELDFYDLSDENKGRILIRILRRYEELLMDDVSDVLVKKFLEAEFSQYFLLVKQLIDILNDENEIRIRNVSISDLMSGDLIYEDIKTAEGVLLIGSGTQLSTNLLRMLRKYAKHDPVSEPIYIKPSHANI